MPSMITVKPAHPDLLVRVPERGMRHLEKGGEKVPLNEYWLRRLREGDVVEVKAPEPKAHAAPASKDTHKK